MFDNSALAYYTCDAVGTITYYNESAAEIWGRKPEIYKEFWCGSWRIFYPDGTPMPIEETPVAKALIVGLPVEKKEMRIQTPDGSFKTLLVFPQLEFNEDGQVTGGLITLVDITKQQRDHIKQATLSAIVQSSDDAIVSKDLKGIITSWNVGAQRIFGYTEKEALGKSITMLIPEDRLNEETHILSNIRAGNRVDHIETVRLDKWGREIPISVTVSPLKDSFGNIIGASKVARDISDKLQVEEKQAMLSAIVESSDDAIVSKDLNGIIMSWNRGAEEIFGYREEEVVGKSITILIPEERLSEEDHILSKIVSGNKIDHFETIRKRKSGEEIPVSITVSPIKDRRGNIIGASKVARDISAQVESQVAMERYIKNLETLNTVGKSISEKLEVKGILQRVTDATTQLTGATYGAFFYNNINDKKDQFRLFSLSGVSSKTFEELQQLYHSVLFEATFVNKKTVRINDITRYYSSDELCANSTISEGNFMRSYMSVPVVSKSGTVIGGLQFGHPKADAFTAEHELMVVNIASQAAVSLDNSKLFEKVRSLSAKKDEFIALASHELKTPLTSIKGYLQILSKKKQDKTSGLFLNKSLNQVEKLNALVEDLLNMSRIETGQLNFNLEEFDLKEMLRDIVETFSYSSQTHKVRESLCEKPVLIKADKQRIEQVILNLLTNAIKYSPAADTVYINLETAGENAIIRVRDEGIGLTENQTKQLFTRFYRAEGTEGISGLGLGLYLTKQIIDRHKGIIGVNSNYGKGSEFYFSLPMGNVKIGGEEMLKDLGQAGTQ